MKGQNKKDSPIQKSINRLSKGLESLKGNEDIGYVRGMTDATKMAILVLNEEQAKNDEEVIDTIPKCKHCGFIESQHSKSINLCPNGVHFFTLK